MSDIQTTTCARVAGGQICPTCEATPDEPCPLASISTRQLLGRQGAIFADEAGGCSPDDGVCDSCQ